MQRNLEHRRLRRWQLIYYLRVFDRATGEVIGHLVDVSSGGVKLVHEKPVEKIAPIDAYMSARLEGDESLTVSMRLSYAWSRPDANPALTLTGFRLVDPAPEALDVIDQLIEEFKLSDAPEKGGNVYGLGGASTKPFRSSLLY